MFRDDRITESLLSGCLRATIDLCWLLPAARILAANFSGEPGHSVGAAYLLAALFLPAVLASFTRIYPEHWSAARGLSAAILVVVWWLNLRTIPGSPVAGGLPTVLYGVASAIYLGIAAYRGLAAGQAASGIRFPREIIRGTVMTSIVLLYLRIAELGVPVWPVLLLPTAIVAIGVMERSSTSDPTSQSYGLQIGGRWVVTLTVAILAILAALILTTAISADFWSGVLAILGLVWRVIAIGITYLAYPFVYLAFWIFQLIQGLLPDIEPPEEVSAPGPPDLPEELGEVATGAGPLATMALQVFLALGAALLIYLLFRSVVRRRERPDPGDWAEVRESLWEPGMLGRTFNELFGGGDERAPTYRTDTERRVRILYRRLFPVVIPERARASETARGFLGRLTRVAPGLAASLATLGANYERARYGQPVEDPDLVEDTRETIREIESRWEDEFVPRVTPPGDEENGDGMG